MKLINNLFVITLIFFQTSIFAQQIGALEINEENVSNWLEKDIEKYEGIYHFGEGDGSNLSLIINDNKVIIQIRNTEYWTQGGYAVEAGIANLSELEMKWEYKNLSGIKIENGKFYSDQYQGEFVIYSDSTGERKGLKINNPWNKWIDNYEIGLRFSETFENKFFGKYPQASYRKLSSSELSTLNKSELKIIRNEIFARYNYEFQKGSEIDLYFQKQEWYISRYKNVSSFLTEIELENIALIKKYEKK